ncbi:hypothetical protein GCM10011391_18770 [Pullulanibacillus camelliae]|uniref:DUF58 domain-containing protein n=1 Tax=Pullulanibacillus camelliae TaxID=1707096 RepID=A0A8J2VX64_9BACL|nr:DUF58 domain-containing protein [Pullulanibacillus camelliae]GGE40241.1 hypothetical protein GCM10011391_18770 [Pullulanibacillus camelliae]
MTIVWIIISTLCCVFIFSIIFSKWGLTNLHYDRYFSKEAVFAGEQIEMIEVLINKKCLPIPWLRLESQISPALQFNAPSQLEVAAEQFHRSLFSMMPFQKITRRHQVTCTKRGYYPLKTIDMTAGDPFGIGTTHRQQQVTAEILVYPRLLDREMLALPAHRMQGEALVQRWMLLDPFLQAGVRGYTPGDALNTINWKLTAKTGQLQVNQHDPTADHHLLLLLNFDLTEDMWMPILEEDRLEWAISYIATLADTALNRGIPTGFGCNSYSILRSGQTRKKPIFIAPNNNREQYGYLLETLASLPSDRSVSFITFLQQLFLSQKTDILMLTAWINDSLQEEIRRLEERGHAVKLFKLHELDNLVR